MVHANKQKTAYAITGVCNPECDHSAGMMPDEPMHRQKRLSFAVYNGTAKGAKVA